MELSDIAQAPKVIPESREQWEAMHDDDKFELLLALSADLSEILRVTQERQLQLAVAVKALTNHANQAEQNQKIITVVGADGEAN